MNDGTHKIFLNTKGDRDGIGRELQLLLDYFDGREPESKLARDMQKKVFEAEEMTNGGVIYVISDGIKSTV